MEEMPNNFATKGFAAGEANKSQARHIIPSQDDILTTFPWQALATAYGGVAGDTVTVQIGRVYEADAIDRGQAYGFTPTPQFCFREIFSSVMYTAGQVVTLTAPTSPDTLCIVAYNVGGMTLDYRYNLAWESQAAVNPFTVIARVARYTPGAGVLGTFEQILMGAAWRSTRDISAFSLANIDGYLSAYIPTACVCINGLFPTLNITALTASGVTDWYQVPYGTSLVATTHMSLVDGEYGKAISCVFSGSIDSSVAGEETIPVTIVNNGLSVTHGAIYLDVVRPDAKLDAANVYKSIAEFTDPTNKTIGIEAFRSGTAPADPFDLEDTPTHKFAVREDDGLGHIYMRWYDSANMKTAIDAMLDYKINDTQWLTDLGAVIGDYITIDWDPDWNTSVKHTGMDFSGSTSAKGTGLSGGNTDHDDSYWHEAGTLESPFIDTKFYFTSGDVRAREFALQGSNATNYWNSTILNVKASTGVGFSGSGTAILDLGGPTGDAFTYINFNGVAGVDITNWTTKGGLTGATIQEISIEDAQPSDKILVIRS